MVFAAYAIVHRGDAAHRTGRIELTNDDLRQMTVAFLAEGRPAPTPEQMRSLVDERVREEVLYREAIALGLDQGDEILKRRMVQKMDFLAEDLSKLEIPTDSALRAYFAAHAAQFAFPPRISFRHIYFSPDARRAHARADAAAALATLKGKPAGWSGAAALGDQFALQDYYADRTPQNVASVFGRDFADSLFVLAPGAWRGPVESGLGWHLVFIESLAAGRVPTYEEAGADVRDQFMAEERAKIRDRLYQEMRSRYEVVLPSGWEHYRLPAGALDEGPPPT